MPQPRLFRYTLGHLMYAITYLATSLAIFGAFGAWLSAVVLASWAHVYACQDRPHALRKTLMLLLLGMCACCCLVPVRGTTRTSAGSLTCALNLQQIQAALRNYHDTWQSFPPACVTDDSGRPMHSWRVLLLPQLGHKSLYDKVRFDEPWDGPHNSKLHAEMPSVYRCESASDRQSQLNMPFTHYFAILGGDTAWAGSTSRSLADFTAGPSGTVMLVESYGHRVHWMEPRDLDLSSIVKELSGDGFSSHEPHAYEDFFTKYGTYRHVTLADGSIRRLVVGVEPELVAKLLTINESSDNHHDLLVYATTLRTARHKWASWFRLATWTIMTLWPLGWVWRSCDAQETRSDIPESPPPPTTWWT